MALIRGGINSYIRGDGIAKVMIPEAPLSGGPWVYDRHGKVLRGQEEVFASGFAIMGLCELWRATSSVERLDFAVRFCRAVRQMFGHYALCRSWPAQEELDCDGNLKVDSQPSEYSMTR